jgi:two-component system NtrC family sensor kinase
MSSSSASDAGLLERLSLAVLATLDGLWEFSIPAGKHVSDLDNPIYFSPRFSELLGYDPSELGNTVEGWFARIHPDDLPHVLTALSEHCTHQTAYRNVECRIQTKTQEYRWFTTFGQAIWDDQGRPTRVAGSICDITERKQAEVALQEREERYRSLVVATTQIVWETDPSGVVSRDLPSWRAYTGQTKEEVLGLGWVNCVHPDDQAHVTSVWVQAVENRTLYDTEYRLRRHDGEYRHFAVRGVPVIAKDGTIREWVGTCTDITERRQAEETLRAREERYRSLVTATAQVVWVISPEGKVLDISDSWGEYTGQTTTDAIEGTGWIDCVHPDDRPEVTQRWIRTLEEGMPFEVEYRLRRQDGEYRDFLGRGVPVFNPDGSVRELVGTCTDITERKQADLELRQSEAQLRQQTRDLEHTLLELQRTQSQLVQTEKMSTLGQLVAGVAHEINNPVNFIYGNITHARDYMGDLLNLVDLYEAHYPNPKPEITDEIEAIDLGFLREDVPQLWQSMSIGAQRIREIVNSLRNFSRLDEAGQKAVDIHQGIDSTLMILQNRLKDKLDSSGTEVIREYGELPEVECYPGQLNQVFMNLICNALDALEDWTAAEQRQGRLAPPQQITIRTEQKGEESVIIRIRDNGPGIPPEVQKKLFTPFFTTKPVGQGTGLGLSISHQIVTEKHRGSLQCFSELGQGTEFVIEIPQKLLTQVAAEAAEAAKSAQS